ncbi:hypothetical protein ACFLQK_02635 [bacterium]
MLNAERERFDQASEALMAALNSGSEVIDQKTRNIIISAISYFRIANEELRKSGDGNGGLAENPDILDRIDAKYTEWERKTSDASDSFYQLT